MVDWGSVPEWVAAVGTISVRSPSPSGSWGLNYGPIEHRSMTASSEMPHGCPPGGQPRNPWRWDCVSGSPLAGLLSVDALSRCMFAIVATTPSMTASSIWDPPVNLRPKGEADRMPGTFTFPSFQAGRRSPGRLQANTSSWSPKTICPMGKGSFVAPGSRLCLPIPQADTGAGPRVVS